MGSMFWQADLTKAVVFLKEEDVRELLEDGHNPNITDENQNGLIHALLTKSDSSQLLGNGSGKRLIYTLVFTGIDVNHQNKRQYTPLHLALTQLGGSLDICQPLLQAGADVNIPDQDGVTPLHLLEEDDYDDDVRELFQQYQPGLWKAVESDNIMDVRKLINLWCRVKIKKGGKTLKCLALDKGTENIIRIIKEIGPSMDLAHAILARNVKAAKEICQSGQKIIIEFRNLGDSAATPLYYAIQSNNPELVKILRKKDAKMETNIVVEDEVEMPIFFTALSHDVNIEVIKELVSSEKDSTLLGRLRFKGNLPIFYCIENDVHPDVVLYLITAGPPEYVTSRNQFNQTPRDLAFDASKPQYVEVIDRFVHSKCFESDGTYRKKLAYDGYGHIWDASKDGVTVKERFNKAVAGGSQNKPIKFLHNLQKYQAYVLEFHEAINNSDLAAIKKSILIDDQELQGNFITELSDCKIQGDGSPPMIQAILRSNIEAVDLITMLHVEKWGRKIDDIRDNANRTPLHYAYGSNSKQIVTILSDRGASEFTVDKDGRTPLSFKEKWHSDLMHQLLKRILQREFDTAEPNPWSIHTRAVYHPTVGGLASCDCLEVASQSHTHNHENQYDPQDQDIEAGDDNYDDYEVDDYSDDDNERDYNDDDDDDLSNSGSYCTIC